MTKHDIWPDKQVVESDIYKEGYDAGLDGAEENESPYLDSDGKGRTGPKHKEWARGLEDGRKAL